MKPKPSAMKSSGLTRCSMMFYNVYNISIASKHSERKGGYLASLTIHMKSLGISELGEEMSKNIDV